MQDVTEVAVGDSAQGVTGAGLSETQEPGLARVDGGHFNRRAQQGQRCTGGDLDDPVSRGEPWSGVQEDFLGQEDSSG